jgi:hypothetical protein
MRNLERGILAVGTRPLEQSEYNRSCLVGPVGPRLRRPNPHLSSSRREESLSPSKPSLRQEKLSQGPAAMGPFACEVLQPDGPSPQPGSSPYEESLFSETGYSCQTAGKSVILLQRALFRPEIGGSQLALES